jgi:hypothetical protein
MLGRKRGEDEFTPCGESVEISNVAYKRTWRELFRDGKSNLDKERKRTKKKERFGRGGLWKLPQRWKSIKVAFGNFLLMISTAA